MGLLGDLLYPDNKTMAEDLNKKYQELLDNNTLHNSLANSYNEVSASVQNFNAQLVALICLQYQLTYPPEKLEQLPETDIPHQSQSIADRVEQYTLAAITIGQTLSSLNAMRKGVVNLYRNAGTYKARIGEGYDNFKTNMQNGLDKVRYRTGLSRSGNVDLLSEKNMDRWNSLNNEISSEERIKLLGDEELPDDIEGIEAVDSEVGDSVTISSDCAELGVDAGAEMAAVEGESLAGALGEVFSAIIGPALMIILVVSEIVSAVEADELNEKLKQAEKDMDANLKEQKESLSTIQRAFKSLLTIGIEDIKEYNSLITDELNLMPSKVNFYSNFRGYTPETGFEFNQLQKFVAALPTLANDQIAVYQQGVDDSLKDIITCIRQDQIQFATDTAIIARIKAFLKARQLDDLGEDGHSTDFIQEIQAEMDVPAKRIQYCNNMRKFMNATAARLAPYYQGINSVEQIPGAATRQPSADPMDHKSSPAPTYLPDPNDFKNLPQ